MALPAHYTDPRLVSLYDTICEGRLDTRFYVDLAVELDVTSMVDVGCGTGVLACELARHGHQVTGVDPAPAMLDVARHRPDGELVRWIEGDARALDEGQADLAIMTGHVAQVFLDDESWYATLTAIHRALRPAGWIAFESRNPDARAWTAWTPEATREVVDDPAGGRVEVWHSVLDVHGEHARFEEHHRFLATGYDVVSINELRFPSRLKLTQSLIDTGFEVVHVFGDWDRRPADSTSPELIFVARRPR